MAFLADDALWEMDTTKGEGQVWDDKDQIKSDTTKPASKFKYFKYDVTGAPLTRLYTQSWGLEKTSGGKPVQIVPTKTKHPACQLHRDAKYNNSLGEPHPVDVQSTETVPKTVRQNVLISYQSTNLLMGLDVFTGSPSYDSAKKDWWQDLKSPQALIDANNSKPAPGLYIVSVHGEILGTKDPKDRFVGAVLGASMQSGSEDEETPNNLGVVPINSATPTNKYSIVMMLIWPSPTLRISLYTGGDAELETEEKVAGWLTESNPYPVEVLKLGHHGSTRGTSIKFFTAAKPENCLISAGTQHNHPSRCPVLCEPRGCKLTNI